MSLPHAVAVRSRAVLLHLEDRDTPSLIALHVPHVDVGSSSATFLWSQALERTSQRVKGGEALSSVQSPAPPSQASSFTICSAMAVTRVKNDRDT